jgi:hypothetical protein
MVRVDERVLMSVGGLVLSLGAAAGARGASLVADFDLAQNPSPSGWSYGHKTAVAGPLSLLSFGGVDPTLGVFVWAADSTLANPDVEKNTTGHDIVLPFGNATYLKDQVTLGITGNGNDFAVARWTVPADGVYRIDATFAGFYTPPIGTAANVSVYEGTTALFSDTILGQATTAYGATVTLKAGETLDFANGGLSGNVNRVGVVATITLVPEPGVGLGLVGLCGLAFRRRR